MIINHNMQAINTHRQMGINQGNLSKNMEKLSSGLRINRAGDDAAGLSISEKMRGQIRGLNQASRNSQDGISMIQTAEGSLDEVHSIAQRMRELAVQASNETNVDADCAALDAEYQQLIAELGRISDTTEFNTQKLLDGTADKIKLQVGANSGQLIEVDFKTNVDLKTMIANNLTGGDVNTHDSAQTALDSVDAFIAEVSAGRSYLGSMQNRLEHTIKNLDNAAENTQAAESRIRDVDMAKEMMEMTKNNILSQAAQSMLAQANQNPQNVLSLLR